MKKRLFSVLLALTLCGSLAIPVFAEPAEEPNAPEESEVLTEEEASVLPDSSEEEGTIMEVRYGYIHWYEDCDDKALNKIEETEEDTVTFRYGSVCFDDSYQVSAEVDILLLATQSPPDSCKECGLKNWGNEKFVDSVCEYKNSDKHVKKELYLYECQTSYCGGLAAKEVISTLDHIWKKGDLLKCRSNDNDTHISVYQYTCSECEGTKTGAKTESHTWGRIGYTGNNYHSGKFHYVEYEYRCTACGKDEVRYEPTTCPGNNNGEGCVFYIVYKVEPPVEVESTDPVEDAAMPEETVLPEDVITPEETVLPEDTTEPENTDTPEETT